MAWTCLPSSRSGSSSTPPGAAGTIYAYDATGGDVLVKGYNSAGNAFSILVDDPNGSLTAANFSRADFVFA